MRTGKRVVAQADVNMEIEQSKIRVLTETATGLKRKLEEFQQGAESSQRKKLDRKLLTTLAGLSSAFQHQKDFAKQGSGRVAPLEPNDIPHRDGIANTSVSHDEDRRILYAISSILPCP